ncbi:MAG: hypothetical protein RSE45_01600 [Bacilli bacterium]
MDADIQDTLTLSDNNEYVICSKTKYNNEMYYYLVDIKDNKNIMICFQGKDELVEVSDQSLINSLVPLFLDEIKKLINS